MDMSNNSFAVGSTVCSYLYIKGSGGKDKSAHVIVYKERDEQTSEKSIYK